MSDASWPEGWVDDWPGHGKPPDCTSYMEAHLGPKVLLVLSVALAAPLVLHLACLA